MKTVDLLVLANSRKKNGNCLAGLILPELKEWVRPISPHTEHGQIPEDQILVFDGSLQRRIKPLDVIRVSLNRGKFAPYHPEDWKLSDRPINFIRGASIDEIARDLHKRSDNTNNLLDLNGKKFITTTEAQKGLSHSIETILVDSPKIFIDSYGKPRAIFSFNNSSYQYVSVTHPELEHLILQRSVPKIKQWYFTVSLTEEYNGCHWMVVEAGLPLIKH